MKKFLFFSILLFSMKPLFAQFRYDNTLYKTVFWEDLCKELQRQNDHLLLDVRSKGEFFDTSAYGGFNIGHLKGARNIDIRELPDRLNELELYKEKPIYVYCSHSQRSRRASKLLSEKGFKQVININGGMTMFNNLKGNTIGCQQSIFESSNPYSLLSPQEIAALLKGDKPVFLLDVRMDSAFKGICVNEQQNGYGKFRQATNIPLASLAASLNRIPSGKKIIIVDEQGDESPEAAKLLSAKGFKDIAILLGGMDNWVTEDPSRLPAKNELYENESRYQLLSAETVAQLAGENSDMLIMDVRGDSVFSNRAKENWRNIGQVKNAVNIPYPELSQNLSRLSPYKNKIVLVYGFFNSPEIFTAAKWLTQNGFSRVYVLMGGLFHLRWAAANIKNHGYFKDWVVNVPSDNL